MYSQTEHRERLKQEAKSMLFEAEFNRQVEEQIAKKQAGKGKTLAEKLGKETLDFSDKIEKRFTIENDDEGRTLMWRALMKDCGYYFDFPSIPQEEKMRRTIQRKYDGLFVDNTYRPPLTSRRDLLTWACGQYNKSLEAREVDQAEHVDCENYNTLLTEFGPDYNRLRGKLGHIRGLFD